MNNKPKLICLTPVKNEAWVLNSFLQATSLWADYIIIADQSSTDGSREIALRYPKVILIDNKDKDLHETNRQRLMFAEARKIDGPKVFIALDADEIFTSNFMQTNDWQKILYAKPGDVFVFRWVALNETGQRYTFIKKWFQWGIYDDGSNPPAEGYIHVARVPWPQYASPTEIQINDFQVMHLQYLNMPRIESKLRFYQCITKIKEPNISAVSLFRQYNTYDKNPSSSIVPDYFTENYRKTGIDIFEKLNLSEPYFWQDVAVLEYFDNKGTTYFKSLDIFDVEWMKKMSSLFKKELKDPRGYCMKLLHFYLQSTQKYKRFYFVRFIDKILKKII